MTYVDSLKKLTDLYCDNLDCSSHFYVQVNLDFSSEHDMIRKFRVGLTLQPVSISIVFCDNLFVVLKQSCLVHLTDCNCNICQFSVQRRKTKWIYKLQEAFT
jgi:hypothetical protein